MRDPGGREHDGPARDGARLQRTCEDPQTIAQSIFVLVSQINSGKRKARSAELGNIAFQITRGYTGISL